MWNKPRFPIRGDPAKRSRRKRRKNGALRAFGGSLWLMTEGSGAEFLPTRWVTITISKICEACIILKRTKFSLTKSKEACPRLRRPRIRGKPAKRLPRKRRKNGALRAFANSPRLGAEGSGAEFLPTPGQAIKSARGMPWHQEPTKDATSCDKPRGGANIH